MVIVSGKAKDARFDAVTTALMAAKTAILACTNLEQKEDAVTNCLMGEKHAAMIEQKDDSMRMDDFTNWACLTATSMAESAEAAAALAVDVAAIATEAAKLTWATLEKQTEQQLNYLVRLS
jgi:hypothetical protein